MTTDFISKNEKYTDFTMREHTAIIAPVPNTKTNLENMKKKAKNAATKQMTPPSQRRGSTHTGLKSSGPSSVPVFPGDTTGTFQNAAGAGSILRVWYSHCSSDDTLNADRAPSAKSHCVVQTPLGRNSKKY